MKITRYNGLFKFLAISIALFSTIHTVGYATRNSTFQRITMMVDNQQYGTITGFANQPISKPTNPSKEGHTFDDWYTNLAYTRTFTFDYMPGYNLTIFGKFNINQYTVTFQPNNGSSTSSTRLPFAQQITLPTTPVRTGHRFAGWFLDPQFLNPMNLSLMPARDLTLYAKWEANNYAITFNTNGGSYLAPKTTAFDDLLEIEPPTRLGHTFAGWFTDAQLSTPFNQARMPATDVTLYAKWTINNYQITFNSNQGSSVSSLTSIPFGSTINAPANPTRSGFVFMGWFRDANLTQPFTFPISMPAENLTLFAKWDVIRFDIIFEVNGGVSLPNLRVEPSTTIPTLPTPQRQGYEFAGWFSNANLTTPFTTTSMPTQNVTIFAKWTAWVVNKLETSFNTTLAITSTGKLYGWGQNTSSLIGEASTLYYQTPTLIPLPTFNQSETIADLQLGRSHALLLTSAGRVFAWGANSHGQLGDGSNITKATPTLISFSSLSNNERVSSIAAGHDHSLAVTTLGRVFAWGLNTSGQLGNGSSTLRSSPTLISISNLNVSETITRVYSGANHSLVLTSASRVFGWGSNANGELGNGSTSAVSTPALISINLNQGETVSMLYVGGTHSFILTSSRRVFGWGSNSTNQINNNASLRLTSPTLVSFTGLIQGETIEALIPGGQHSLAITSNSRVFAWGDNEFGQLGLGTGSNQRLTSPTLITIPNLMQGESVVTIHAGFKHTFAFTSNNRVYGWGLNTDGQLGDNSLISKSLPRVITISISEDSFYRLQTNSSINPTHFSTTTLGHVYGWGQNSNGKLGDGTTTSRTSPVKIAFPSLQAGEELISIKSGDQHTVALTNLGKLYTWGNGAVGALGTGNTTSRLTPNIITIASLITNERVIAIEVGGTHSLALTSNGRVFVWGSNTRGQLGLGTSSSFQTVSSPTLLGFSGLGGSETIQSIHAGYEHNFAISTLGRVFTWGFNGSNVLGTTTISVNSSSFVPLLLSFSLTQGETITKIYPGMSHNFAITSSQRIFTWGLNSSGQLGTGNTTNRTTPTLLDISSSLNAGETMVDFALGTSHSIGLTSSGRLFSWGGNASGQLGNGTTTLSSMPVLISVSLSTNERILAIGASNNHSLMLTSTGRIFEWGSNINLRPTAITITST